MILSRVYRVVAGVCLAVVLMIAVHAIVNASKGQWDTVGQNMFYLSIILLMGVVAYDYSTVVVRRVRR